MATSIVKPPLLRSIALRSYATAQVAPIGGVSDYKVQVANLPNKLVVASAENDSLISRVSILVRAGSRNETPDNAGVAHVLRAAAGLSTRKSSQFAITRNVQQVGANLSVTADREVIAYTLEGTRQAIESALPYLTDVVTQQEFRPWELSDNVPRLRLELAQRPPQLRAVDLLHKAAYRRGLGNSLFIAKYKLGKISSETVQHFYSSRFVTGNVAVVGLGVDQGELVQYAQNLNLTSGEGKVAESEYYGGEIRSDKGGDFAYVAIAGKGTGICSDKDALSFAILQKAFGAGPSLKWSSADHGVLSQSVGANINDPFSVVALNYSYSDSGLFGALIAAPAATAGHIVECAVRALKSGNVPDENIKRGKAQLKTELLLTAENGSQSIQNIGFQATLTGAVKSPAEFAAEVDSISPADVKAAAKKVASSKLSLAAYGNLKTVPFLDQLK